MGRRKLLPSVSDVISRSGEPMPGIPLIEVCNMKRVLVENHYGIIGYQSEEIIVKVRNGTVYVYGECLQMIRMNRSQLVINGRILSISFRETT